MTERYSIGIDLGTTNCSLAYAALEGDHSRSEVLLIDQWSAAQSISALPSLPSFLYRPLPGEKTTFASHAADGGNWVPGRLARDLAAVQPSRVVSSAKSWLCASGVDQSGRFLPWGSDQLGEAEKISPVEASALLLHFLRRAWDQRHGSEAPFDRQIITVTVPASFDAAAQRLTLQAAELAGFPEGVRLLEEPQAAFCRWLEIQTQEGGSKLRDRLRGISCVLVIDIGGGTSDFSLFDVGSKGGKSGRELSFRRIAVSDHILLGGDNIDLAMAHVIAEVQIEESLSPEQWGHLIAQCRAIKEEALQHPERREAFPISIPGRGSGLFAGSIRAEISAADVAEILYEGFYPACGADEKTKQSPSGLRELGLPYAWDHAASRHLAEFLHGRPAVDAVLFNGGSLTPLPLQERLLSFIESWQGKRPVKLAHAELDVAVARGAASHGWNQTRQKSRIEETAPRSLFLEAADSGGKEPALVCLLAKGAPCNHEVMLDNLNLELVTNQPVRFQIVSSNRIEQVAPGQVLSEECRNHEPFHRLPPFETVIKTVGGGKSVPVRLSSRLNSLGLLQVECVNAENPKERWPLEFNVSGKAHPIDATELRRAKPRSPVAEAGFRRAASALRQFFDAPAGDKGDSKISAHRIFLILEEILGLPRHSWDIALLRRLWEAHSLCFSSCYRSVGHEETWMNVAGFLLRPGYGVSFDHERVDRVWKPEDTAYDFPGRRINQARYVLWRRLAGGLNRERQEKLAEECLRILRLPTEKPSAELLRLSGALERIGLGIKKELLGLLLERGKKLAGEDGYCEPCWVALTLLLNRAPLYAGPETVLPATEVISAFESLRELDWVDKHKSISSLFLRAARRVNDPRLDLPNKAQKEIIAHLRRAGVSSPSLVPLEKFVEIRLEDQNQLLGEAAPPGLTLAAER